MGAALKKITAISHFVRCSLHTLSRGINAFICFQRASAHIHYHIVPGSSSTSCVALGCLLRCDIRLGENIQSGLGGLNWRIVRAPYGAKKASENQRCM